MKPRQAVIFIFLVSLTSAVLGARKKTLCPQKFLKREKLLLDTEEACYRFEPGARTGFREANNKCKSDGGTLVSVTSPRENYRLVKRLQQLRLRSKFWIGLQRLGGNYKWVDKSNVSYTFWQNDKGFGGRKKACVVLDVRQGSRWSDDIPCDCEPDTCPGFICKYVVKEKKTKPVQTKTASIAHTTAASIEYTTAASIEDTTEVLELLNTSAEPSGDGCEFDCSLDCGMDGYKSLDGCSLCECND